MSRSASPGVEDGSEELRQPDDGAVGYENKSRAGNSEDEKVGTDADPQAGKRESSKENGVQKDTLQHKQSKPEEDTDVATRLKVTHLTRNITDAHLEEIFSTFGEVKLAEVQLHPVVKLSKGFGLVEYHNTADAQKAQMHMNGAQIDGNDVEVNFLLMPRKRPEPVPRRPERGLERGRDYGDHRRREAMPHGRSPRRQPLPPPPPLRSYRERTPPRGYRDRSRPRGYRDTRRSPSPRRSRYSPRGRPYRDRGYARMSPVGRGWRASPPPRGGPPRARSPPPRRSGRSPPPPPRRSSPGPRRPSPLPPPPPRGRPRSRSGGVSSRSSSSRSSGSSSYSSRSPGGRSGSSGSGSRSYSSRGSPPKNGADKLPPPPPR